MKRIVSSLLFTLAVTVASSAVFADSVVNAYTCKLKEGKTQEELQAANSKWLK